MCKVERSHQKRMRHDNPELSAIIRRGLSSSRQRKKQSDLLSYCSKLFGKRLVTAITLIIICKGGGERRMGKVKLLQTLDFRSRFTALLYSPTLSFLENCRLFKQLFLLSFFSFSSLDAFLLISFASAIRYGHASLWLKEVHSSVSSEKGHQMKANVLREQKYVLPSGESWMILHSSSEHSFFSKISDQTRPCCRSV